MKNKKIVTTLLVAGLILLSGCVDNKTDSPTATTQASTQITSQSTNNENMSTVSTGSANPLIPANEDWCTVGNKKIIAGKEFTIVGTITDNAVVLCKAELEIPNGKTTYYFSEDGNITRMNSSISSSNGNASASASVSSSSNSSSSDTNANTNSNTNSTTNWSISR